MSNGSLVENEILESDTTRLSLAVSLQDRFSKTEPIGRTDVQIPGLKKPLRNPSSYYLFLDLPAGDYLLQVRSDYYFDQDEGPIKIGAQGLKDPLVITLLPGPSYPFPPGETLVRGILRDLNQNPIPHAHLSWKDKFESMTSEKGEFVIYFGVLTENDVIEVNHKKFVKGDLDETINMKIIKSDGSESILQISDVEVGKTKSIKKT
jgi:hypothetical protein